MGSPASGGDNSGTGKSMLPSGTATGASIASMGLSAYSDVLKGQAVQQADIFKAGILEENAKRGEAAAVETGGDLTRKLANDLGNIDAIRAASRTSINSPTGAAISDTFEQRGLLQKSITVDSIMAQAKQQQSEADYLRMAGSQALKIGYLSAATDAAAALAKATPLGGG
jgi:hypothetical protein